MTALAAMPLVGSTLCGCEALRDKRFRAEDDMLSIHLSRSVGAPMALARRATSDPAVTSNQEHLDLELAITALVDQDRDTTPVTKRPSLCRARTVDDPLELHACLGKSGRDNLWDFHNFKRGEFGNKENLDCTKDLSAPVSPILSMGNRDMTSVSQTPILQASPIKSVSPIAVPQAEAPQALGTYSELASGLAASFIVTQQQLLQQQIQQQQLVLLKQQQQLWHQQQLHHQLSLYQQQQTERYPEWTTPVPWPMPAFYGWQPAQSPPDEALVIPAPMPMPPLAPHPSQSQGQAYGIGAAGPRGVTKHAAQQQLTAGRLVEMAREQEGSRILQRALMTMSPIRLQAACDELGPHLGELATNLFGNYLVSSMATLPQAQAALVAALTGRVVELMQHAQGSRVVQAALEALPNKAVRELVAELEGSVADCAVTTNGSWSLVAAFRATRAGFIITEISQHILTLSTHVNGSRAVQRIVPDAASHETDVTPVVISLIESPPAHLQRLASDQYGNYVVQIALRVSEATPKHQARLVELLLPSLPKLSTSKAGSNVAEALISCATSSQLAVARELLHGCSPSLSAHCFGRHVIAALARRT